MRFTQPFIIAAVAVLIGIRALAAEPPASGTKTADDIAAARLKLNLDSEQTTYTRRLEEQKLEVERMKAWITGGSILVPLLVAAISLGFGVMNQNAQARLQREVQAASERASFALKAAEAVLSANGPLTAKNRAMALRALFPDRLPADFETAFNPNAFTGPKVEFFEASPDVSPVAG